MDRYNEKCFDNEFEKVDGLVWYPWVGVNYDQSEERVLIIGESHYVLGEGEEYDRKYEYCKNNPSFTRECIYESMICGDWTTKTYDNLHRVLFKSNGIEKDVVWKHLSYYNFIPRTMDYRIRERPLFPDYYNAWRQFIEVVNILKPTCCIFIGVEASNSFNLAMQELNVTHDAMSWGVKVGNTYSRKAYIQSDKNNIPVVFMQHTSQFFSWEKWNSVLSKQIPSSLDYLMNLVVEKQGVQTVERDNLQIPSDESEVINVPTWLSHKPIIACDYTNYTGVFDDAKFLSLGKAQYNQENLSIKLFRKSKNRWSRQSEEIPLERVADFTIMLLALIKSMDSGKGKNTILGEELIAEDELDFAHAVFQMHKSRIIRGLTEIKAMLNDINLEKL
jgi:hypothetical protein